MFSFRFLLHVVSRFIDTTVEDEKNDQSGPIIANDEGRIEDGILEELNGALAFRQISVADKVLPSEDGDEEEQCGYDPRNSNLTKRKVFSKLESKRIDINLHYDRGERERESRLLIIHCNQL